MGLLSGSLLAQQTVQAGDGKYVVAVIAAIASIIVAIISACFSVVGLIISRMNQSALQRQQAALMQSNERELESLKSQLTLSTQSELEKAKSELAEKAQERLEAVKADLQHRIQVAGIVRDNRLKAAEVLTAEFGNVASEIYAYQRLIQLMPDWAAQNRSLEVARISSLLTEANRRFNRYTLYFDGLAQQEVGIVFAELMSIICDDVGSRERLDKAAFRLGVVFANLRQQLGIEPLSNLAFGLESGPKAEK
jgi:hypothetical protein